jgi:diacylglycerol kinase (ATP)
VKKILLIINPVSGKGLVRDALLDILSVFSRAGCEVTVYVTEKQGDAESLAARHGAAYDLCVCTGGDGTLSETVCGLMQLDRPPVIGYIPMGTTNDMAATLKLPKDAVQAAECVLDGRVFPLDIGRLGRRYFTYIAAFGAFTEVSYSTPQETKRALGPLAYILSAMTSLTKLTAYNTKIEYDDGVIEGSFVFGAVSNSLSVAGILKLDPATVSLGDGYFEVLLIQNPNSLAALNGIISCILRQEYDQEGIYFLHTKKIRFTFETETAWTRDGESGGFFHTVEAQNFHQALSIMIPEAADEH